MNSQWVEYAQMIGKATVETLWMVSLATFFSYLFGLPLGVVVVITEKGHILPKQRLHGILEGIINLTRSVPFIILLVALIPFTRLVAGTSIGPTASVVPLVVGAIPFVARMAETSFKELDRGVIEAAQAMGATPWQIIRKVIVPESLPSLVLGVSITTITLIGYSAMAGAVGGGGLGDLAIRYGYYRYQKDLMLLTILVLILLVQIVQTTGSLIARKIDKKNR